MIGNNIRLCFLFVITVLLTGCSASKKFNKIGGEKLQNFSSFAFYKKSVDEMQGDKIFKSDIVLSIKEKALAKGYDFSKEPDFYISPTILSERGPGFTPSIGIGTGLGFGWGFGSIPIRISGGKNKYFLVVDIVDSKTEKLIWRGSQKLRKKLDPNLQKMLIDNCVEKIFKDFPIK